MDTTPKIGRVRRGWELAKCSWAVLKLDKELAALPILSMILAILFSILAVVVAVGVVQSIGHGDVQAVPKWLNVVGFVAFYFVVTAIANFFGAAVVYGATQRFRGGNPTIGSSLAGARAKFRPLLLFSFMMASIGLVLRALEERVPLAGKIAVWLVGAAWVVANTFAIPIIVLGEDRVSPVTATRQSAAMVKRVWGQSVVVQFGLAAVGFLSILAYILVFTAADLIILGATGFEFAALNIIVFALSGLGLLALVLILTTMGSIAKAALYHYVTTGIAPATFNQELLRTAMRQKQKRNLFAS